MMIEDDTLVIVTSDHSHTMVLPGYTGRDTEFPGLLGKNSDDGKFETSIGKIILPRKTRLYHVLYFTILFFPSLHKWTWRV